MNNDNLYKFFQAFKVTQREIGEYSAFREMLDHLIENPSEALNKDLPRRMRKILIEMDQIIERRTS